MSFFDGKCKNTKYFLPYKSGYRFYPAFSKISHFGNVSREKIHKFT